MRAIYRQRYFKPSMCTAFTAPLALMHFDAAVNHGVSAAIQMLQGVARVTVDGEIGPERFRQSDRAASSISSTITPKRAAAGIAHFPTSGASAAAG